MLSYRLEECGLDRVVALRYSILYTEKKHIQQCVFPLDDSKARHWVVAVGGEDVGGCTLHYDPKQVLGQLAYFRLRGLCVREDMRKKVSDQTLSA